MRDFFIKRAIVLVILLVLLGGGFLISKISKNIKDEKTQTEEKVTQPKTIGQSIEGRNIEVYTFGNGKNHILFVGGIHGGYEWNSILLAYNFIDYLKQNPNIIPQNITVSIIPSANPDGVYKITNKEGPFTIFDVSESDVIGLGRFNANNVDLNRNFDCKWKPESTWRNNSVSAGTSAFSEPEAKAIKDFVLENNPVAVVFWHSQSNAVYASECGNGILTETTNIMNAYSEATGYPAIDSFDAYEITGDAEGWLASINIPAITVELKTHESVEWEKNLEGIKTLFNYYK